MELRFSKFHGAGNDFVAIDMTSSDANLSTEQIQRMCNRKTGIGADGVLILTKSEDLECKFRLLYYNADGKEGSLCGNGSRCSLAFAERIGLVSFAAEESHVINFEACDGIHTGGRVPDIHMTQYLVDIKDVSLDDVNRIDEDNFFLNNGSPHHVRFTDNLADVDVAAVGRKLRWGMYGEEGANVDFVQVSQDDASRLSVRTFERGVEGETSACGTGAAASAIAAFLRRGTSNSNVSCRSHSTSVTATTTTRVSMAGGVLEVRFTVSGKTVGDIRLYGPATHVFDGTVVV